MPPDPTRTRTLRRATAESLAIDAATVEAAGSLRSAGVDFVLLKGPALLTLLYDPGEERSYDDADLLVAEDERDPAIAALAEIGFEPRFADPRSREVTPYEIQLVRPGRTAGSDRAELIEIHTGFDGVADPAALWRSLLGDRGSVELFGTEIEVPSVTARLALVAIHAGAHGVAHLRSRRDVERAVERFDAAAWSAAWELARLWSARDLFVVGTGLAGGGPELLASLGVGHSPSTRARMRGRGMPRAQRSLEQLAATTGLRPRIALVLRKAFPAPEVMRSWKPLARRGPAGLTLAYLWRPAWLAGRLAEASLAWVRARRGG